MSKWLQIKNLSGDGKERRAEMWIEGVIGVKDWFDDSGTTAKEFIKTVDALGDLAEIDLFINTPGGVVSDGITITNYLINHPASVNVTVMGQAASIGSVIAQAADPGKLHMALGTTQFIHDPLTVIVGDADDMRWAAALLDKLRDSIVAFYKRRTDLSDTDIKQLMKDDTTMTAEEAVEWGFADSMDADIKAVASQDIRPFIDAARKAFNDLHKPPGPTAEHNIQGDNVMSTKDEPAVKPSEITAQQLEQNNPNLLAEISNKAVTAERQRVKAIMATPLAGSYGDIINAGLDNGDSPEKVAQNILAAEAKSQTDTLNQHKADAPDPLDDPAEEDEGVSDSASIEVKAQAAWNKSEDLRNEFGDSFNTYLAYRKAEAKGQVRVLGKK